MLSGSRCHDKVLGYNLLFVGCGCLGCSVEDIAGGEGEGEDQMGGNWVGITSVIHG
jgi:hypothetical protein